MTLKANCLSKLVHYPTLSVAKAHHVAYEQKTTVPDNVIVDNRALLGIEIEVENCGAYTPIEYYWSAKEDHSLRNNGVEFTSIPLRGYQVPYAIQYLKKQIMINNPNHDFSPRTSVHVHLNVRDMTWEQIKVLVMLYAVFERHFFTIAGTKRESSIFCVPLYKTDETYKIPNLENSCGQSKKYSALNLGTIIGSEDCPSYGTIEFRHLYGTLDEPTLYTWINNILMLRKASLKYSYDELLAIIHDMNTTSEYIRLYNEVFGGFANNKKLVKYDFEHCVSMLKLALFSIPVNNKYQIQKGSTLYQRIYKDSPGEKQEAGQKIDEILIKKYAAKWTTLNTVNWVAPQPEQPEMDF